MNKVLTIDPSGTGTTGIFLIEENTPNFQFTQIQTTNWKEHYQFIKDLIHQHQPNLIVYENTNYINKRNADSLNLVRLLGAIEFLPLVQIDNVNVLRVKELAKKLFKGEITIPNLEYSPGRGKGWLYNNKRISIHQLDAFLIYWIYKYANSNKPIRKPPRKAKK